MAYVKAIKALGWHVIDGLAVALSEARDARPSSGFQSPPSKEELEEIALESTRTIEMDEL